MPSSVHVRTRNVKTYAHSTSIVQFKDTRLRDPKTPFLACVVQRYGCLERHPRTHTIFWFTSGLTNDEEEGRFLGVPLHNMVAAKTFREEGHDFATKCVAAMQKRFCVNHPVAKATTLLFFFGWPWLADFEKLTAHGNAEVQPFPAALAPLNNVVEPFIRPEANWELQTSHSHVFCFSTSIQCQG